MKPKPSRSVPTTKAAAIVLTVEEVAAQLKTPVSTARQLIVAGKIRGFKVGNRWRVRVADFERYIDERIDEELRRHRPAPLFVPPTKRRFS